MNTKTGKITGIVESVNFSSFCDAWNRFDDRKDSFSYEGKRALFDYLESMSEEMGEPIELDIVALDCEYVEYDSATSAWREYNNDKDDELLGTDDGIEEQAMEWLQDRTQVIEFNGGVIIFQF